MLGMARHILTLALRGTVALLAVALVLWSFYWVGSRPWRQAAERGARVELVVMNWSGGGGQKEEQIVADLVAAFERQHPDIRVRRINPGDAGAYTTKLQTMMAAGTPPDVFYMGTERFASFAGQDLLMPLEPLIADDAAAGRDTLNLADFYTAAVDCFRYDGERTGQGPLYGIPKDFTTWGFYYNKTLFDRAGVPYPADDWTWDDFIGSARRIAQLDDVIAGAEFVVWPVTVRLFLMTYGLDVTTPDFATSRLQEPAVRARLNQLRAWRFDEPPGRRMLVSGDSQVAQGADIFVTGKVGLAGPLGRWVVPTYRGIRDFEWDFAPLPRGDRAANAVATVAWSISRDSRHPAEAWTLLKFLCGPEGQARAAELGLAIPTLRAVAASPSFASPDLPPRNDAAYLVQAEYAQVAAVPRNPQWEGRLGTRMEEALRAGKDFDTTLRALEDDWERARTNPLLSADFPRLRWGIVGWIVGVPLAVGLVLLLTRWRRGRPGRIAAREELAGYTLVSPWVIGFVAFMAFPIVLSFVLSLARWNGASTLDFAQWVGLGNYSHLLLNDPRFWTSLRVTVYYALFAVPLGQLAALGAALLMNHDVRLSGFFRSAWYLPSVLAGVGVAILWRWVFDGALGLMNTYLLGPACRALNDLAATLHLPLPPLSPPKWFTGDARWFGPPAFALMSLWAIGGTMVSYLAGLKGIPTELYEAAAIDGATSRQRFRHVTLPMLSPVIFFNVIMAIIGSFQVFTQAYVMTGGGPGDDTRFYVLYLYDSAFVDHHMGYASAMAWLLLVLILALTLFVMRGSRRFVYYEALKA